MICKYCGDMVDPLNRKMDGMSDYAHYVCCPQCKTVQDSAWFGKRCIICGSVCDEDKVVFVKSCGKSGRTIFDKEGEVQ